MTSSEWRFLLQNSINSYRFPFWWPLSLYAFIFWCLISDEFLSPCGGPR